MRMRLAACAGVCLSVALVVVPTRPARSADDPPAAATGSLAGTVADKSTGRGIGDAGVELVGTGQTVRTDLDGRYAVRAAPGTYELRIFAPGYRSIRLDDVVVEEGRTTPVDASLEPLASAGVEIIEVVGQAAASTEATQLLFRKKASVVSDTLSAEMMKKTPGSAAADLVKRAPAVTVKDDKFLFVRGLGERYTAATLNGSRLPSTDPEKRAVPLDLFPADFLESLAIIKSYSPELQGDFSGGLAELRLRDFPPQFTFGMSIKAEANTQTTFGDFDTYRGSSWDPFGLGTYFRKIPRGTPKPLDNESPMRFADARRFRDIWNVDTETAPPGFEWTGSIGNSLGPFGFQLGGVFSNGYAHRDERTRQYRNRGDIDDPEIGLSDDFLAVRSVYETVLGGLLTASYKVGWNNKFSLRTLINRGSTDQVRVSIGETENLGFDGQVQQQTAFQYNTEQLIFSQFAGEHEFKWLRVDWRTAIAQTTADQPDTRYQTRNGQAGEPLVFVEDSLGGQRLYNSLTETMSDTGMDASVPFTTALPYTNVWSGLPAKVQGGWGYLYRERDFTQRRFRYIVPCGAFDCTDPTQDLLVPENIRPGGVDFEELTKKRDQYKASEEVLGGYGLLELPILRDRLRLVGGLRMEYSNITLHVTEDEADPRPTRIEKKNTDPLPSVNLIYSPLEDMNVRLGFSETVSRPDFRELSPAEFPAQRGERAKVGNPFLEQASITSYDARWEWFFSPSELVSASLFYKELDKPIEQTVIQRASDLVDSFANADSGWVYGLEFEGRKDLGFLSPRLRYLSLLANATWAQSEVTSQKRSTLEVQTNDKRKLQGQPDFIINTSVEYAHPRYGTARILFNTIDDRITGVGTFGLPDIVETRRNQLDAVLIVPLSSWLPWPLTAKLTVKNILNDPVVTDQGGETQERYSEGVGFGLGLSYSP